MIDIIFVLWYDFMFSVKIDGISTSCFDIICEYWGGCNGINFGGYNLWVVNDSFEVAPCFGYFGSWAEYVG